MITPFGLYIRHESTIEDIINDIIKEIQRSGQLNGDFTISNCPEDLNSDEWEYVEREVNRRLQ